MIRRLLLPLGLLVVAFGAFVAAAGALTDAQDLAGIYFTAMALVALRAQQRMAGAV
jgi:hypothetical protein